ncbi:zinc finger CCCH domain-containing protein 3 [Neodiprion lecontei]|uniref:Zinc finger CCCH domain-containing protein 3 n=1 Tax=Neodiprion lecontei TaxID=441921 RepID=A0A6J0CER4_NEOLC|nr:zinc finger CCCH domain-containing protein 3 [Neodiprion lecontei]
MTLGVIMEGNLHIELSNLTWLIEQHKKMRINDTSLAKREDTKFSYQPHPACAMERHNHSKYSYIKQSLPSGRVHVNPNFKPKLPGIHINPRMGAKPLVYVNPNMIRNFATQSFDETSCGRVVVRQNSVYESKVKSSVHVNPRLMKELSAVKEKPENSANRMQKSNLDLKTPEGDINFIDQSKTKLVKINPTLNLGAKRLSNSNLVLLSRRKLVRVKRCSKSGPAISPLNPGKARRLSNSNLRKTMFATKYKLVIERVNLNGTSSAVPRNLKGRQAGLNKYKIDRTHLQKVRRRLSIGKSSTKLANKKASGSMTGLVRIGGILYKSSRNQLVRSLNDPQPSKRKRCVINVKGDRFVMASNGKKLRRLCTSANNSGNLKCPNPVSRVDIGGMTFVERAPNVLVRAHTKRSISTKVKQRSIQILRNKMRKNNQPCLIFQKFGYCAGQVKSTCPRLHDKKQVALCRNFLQGKCLLDNCQMSHAVCPEKMPTCKYFLEGCCNRDQCPYLHVKVSPNTPICTQFLRGYCVEANKCKQRHVYVCPEFERSGICAKGKYCPYPHKSSSTECKQLNKSFQRKVVTRKKISKSESTGVHSLCTEDRKRYYDEAGSSRGDIEKKRKKILNSVQIMKSVKIAEMPGNNEGLHKANDSNEVTINENNDDCIEVDSCPKRIPLGPLPAYIPID